MNPNSNETILRRERLHKGIFILPAFIFAVPLVPLVALFFILSLIHQKTNDAFQQLQAQQNPSWLLYLPVVALGVPWLVASLVSFLCTLLAYTKSEITLTNRRLLFRTGFIMRVSGELPLENIEAIYLVEPLLGRLFGFGSILVTTVGGAKFPLRHIGAPNDFHAALQNAVAAAKARSQPPQPPPDDDSRFMPKA
jgi:uncharacterized membrane protein YdbT with pleckstrin-like domain